MSSIRVILVDDHPVVRKGLRDILENAGDIEVVGEADSGQQALLLVEQLTADILLLDMELPDIPGTQVAVQVKQNHPALQILSISAHNDSIYVRQVLELGAAGYLMKEEAPEVILDAVHGIARGQQGWLSRSIAEQVAGWMQSGSAGPSALTVREQETLALLVQGKTNHAIAVDLKISEKTVEKHIKGIFDKLDVNSRVDAAVVAIKQGIIKT
jgi:DNA-binding NarL/FixJ family response regulator